MSSSTNFACWVAFWHMFFKFIFACNVTVCKSWERYCVLGQIEKYLGAKSSYRTVFRWYVAFSPFNIAKVLISRHSSQLFWLYVQLFEASPLKKSSLWLPTMYTRSRRAPCVWESSPPPPLPIQLYSLIRGGWGCGTVDTKRVNILRSCLLF
jgi:hypothetical protein